MLLSFLPSFVLKFFKSKKNPLEEDPSDEVASETNFSRLLFNKYGLKGQCWEHELVPRRGEKIRVASFNVLAQSLADKHSNLYSHLRGNKKALSWEHRKVILSDEIIRLNADIICLQEVQEGHLESFFRPLLEGSGYQIRFAKRRGTFTDGGLIAFRATKFKSDPLYFRVRPFTAGVGSGLDTPQNAMFIRLTSRKSGLQLVVVNTHLLFSPGRGDTKIGQLGMLFSTLHQEGVENGPVPFVICGDFNCATNTPMTSFITDATINFDGLKQCDISGQVTDRKKIAGAKIATVETALPMCSMIERNSIHCFLNESPPVVEKNTLEHPFFLQEVFHPSDNVINSRSQISSIHTDAWRPDGIYFGSGTNVKNGAHAFRGTLELMRKVSLPSLDLIEKTTGPWPTKHLPSDHIPLLAEFQLFL